MRIEISVPETYRSHPETVASLIEDLQAEAGSIEVVPKGWSGRRSAQEAIPFLVATLVIARAIGQELSNGFLQAVGSEALGAIKRVVGRASESSGGSPGADVWLSIRSESGESGDEYAQELTLRLPRGEGANLSVVLDRGFVCVDQLFRENQGGQLGYDRETGQWLTLDEQLASNVREQRQRRDVDRG